MKIKVISILLCFTLVVTVFAGCNNTNTPSNNDDNSTTSNTNNSTSEVETNEDGTPVTPNESTKATRDNRLVGKWKASTEIPINEAGATVTSRCTVVFKADGTFVQTTTEAQARRMIIDTYLITFNCKTEKELDDYIRKYKKTTLEGYVVMALANMSDEDFKTQGTWKTKNNNTIYETTKSDGKNVVETATYTVLDDGNTIKIQFDDGVGGKITMTLTKA